MTLDDWRKKVLQNNYEQRLAREELRFARFWDVRIREPNHTLALLAKDHPDLVENVRQIAWNAFRSGIFFADREHNDKENAKPSERFDYEAEAKAADALAENLIKVDAPKVLVEQARKNAVWLRERKGK